MMHCIHWTNEVWQVGPFHHEPQSRRGGACPWANNFLNVTIRRSICQTFCVFWEPLEHLANVLIQSDFPVCFVVAKTYPHAKNTIALKKNVFCIMLRNKLLLQHFYNIETLTHQCCKNNVSVTFWKHLRTPTLIIFQYRCVTMCFIPLIP